MSGRSLLWEWIVFQGDSSLCLPALCSVSTLSSLLLFESWAPVTEREKCPYHPLHEGIVNLETESSPLFRGNLRSALSPL